MLLRYLRETCRISSDETPLVKTLAGGVSNRTVLVERPSGEAWVLKQALPKLRVAVDWFSDPRRIEREAAGLRYLSEVLPHGSTPDLLFEDRAHHLLAMTAIAQPHENWKTMLMEGRIDEAHFIQFGEMLATIHRRSSAQDMTAFETPDFATPARLFDDRGFFETLRVEPYYRYTAVMVPESEDFFADLIEDMRMLRFAVVHGDFSPKNILVHDGRLVLLDHEVIHWGHAAFDAGFAMAHFLSKAHHFPEHRARLALGALRFTQAYRRGIAPAAFFLVDYEARWVKHTLACLLARVAGRSPLEYLSPAERHRQQAIVLDLIRHVPDNLPELIDVFLEKVASHADDSHP